MTKPDREDFVGAMARAWADTNHMDGQYTDVPQRELAEVGRDRVIQLWDGEVRVSEMTKADRVVWRGRPRVSRDLHKEIEIADARWWNYYDTSSGERAGERLFGNRNIGMVALTNLHVPGQLGFDTAFMVELLYITPLGDITDVPWNASAVFIVGDKPQTPQLPLSEWFRGVAPLNLIVPVRQNVSARIDFFGDDKPCKVRFHIEGLEIPTQQRGPSW